MVEPLTSDLIASEKEKKKCKMSYVSISLERNFDFNK